LIEENGTAGQTTSFVYDANGNVVQTEDPLGRVTGQAYDELDRLATVVDPALQLTAFAYDGQDNLSSVTDPRSLQTSYVYNGFGEQTSQTSPDTGTSTSTIDAAGNVDAATDARSATGDLSYDALNRVIEIEYGDETVVLDYDSGTNGAGQLTSITDGAGTTTWTYDAVGRVTERSQTTGTVTLEVGYGYDTYGRPSSLTTPSGQTVTYEYTNGELSGLKVNGSWLLSQLAYQPFGPIKGWTWGNSTTTTRIYDTDGQLTQVSSAGSSTYTFFDDGNIASRTDDFVAVIPSSSGTTMFDVSSTSNRLESAAGQLIRSYGYDAAGNTTSDGMRTFTYNNAGRMKTSTNAGLTTTYSYNGLGERVMKTSSASTTYFAYDEAGHLVGEYDAAGDMIQETVWLGDTPVATLKPNVGNGVSVFYIHTDHLNTPRRITQPSDNAIVWRWDSDPFGATVANDDPDSDSLTFAFNLRFPGQYFDAESALHYNYFRDYDAVIGRYLESDPVGLLGGTNPYLYVGANPFSYYDPYGLWEFGDPLPQGLVDFSAGLGDTLTFGLTRRARELGNFGTVNVCSNAYDYGGYAGMALGMVGGYLHGTKAAARAISGGWQNFSHSAIPHHVLKRMDNRVARWLDRVGNRLNGDHLPVSRNFDLHARIDRRARGGLDPDWLRRNPLMNPFWQAVNRVPYTPGAALYGAGSKALNSCDCGE
jgi:RHS repeat-associated protein